MQQLADSLWRVDGEAVPFFGVPYTTRMTVVRLTDGRLWIHSPIRLTEQLKARLADLGEVRYLMAPNHLHRLYLP
ncbi:DUF4336 domain-containing protein [Gallaecimonas sp. GXIMD4217]|uniref:DUF4336 domain-containing protein n=1 Tax=Gallaecimonas sp. GXIMD4217 TaxID=3131927 RepID=UPI00311B3037